MATPVPTASTPSTPSTPLIVIAILMTVAMALPMLVLYTIGTLGPSIVADLGIGRSALGALTSACFGVAVVLSLWAGQLVELIGPRAAIGWLFVAVAVSFAVMAMSRGYALLIVGVGLCGFAQALANPATNKMIAEHVPVKLRGSVVGLKQAGVQIAALAAGTVVVAAAARFGWRGALALVVPCALLAGLAVALFLPSSSRE